jgi:hypothetical protein
MGAANVKVQGSMKSNDGVTKSSIKVVTFVIIDDLGFHNEPGGVERVHGDWKRMKRAYRGD